MAKTPKPPRAQDQTPDETEAQPRLAQFESSVAELETLVETLEAGDVSLEQALAKFERGVTLARQCQALLRNAELRVDQLLADAGEERVAGFDAADAGDDTADDR